VTFLYRAAIGSYLFNDDFNWFQDARRFAFSNLFHLERYNHFYRPVVEIYFYVGRRLFGCSAQAFHVVSVALHLVNTLVVYLFARDLAARRDFGFLSALLFCTNPGYYEAVAWVAAITDLLPAVWYLLTLWLFLRFLRADADGTPSRRAWYAAALATFLLCLLTHESSATLLPMLGALEIARRAEQRGRFDAWWLRSAVLRYLPFAVLLAGSLTIAFVVNSRSYLVREGHYALGWHAVPHMLQFILSLYVGPRSMLSYAAIVSVTILLLWKGSPRVRFFVVLLFATLAPASFFTWANVSRYLYVPAAAFALLLAAGLLALERAAATVVSQARARRLTAALAAAMAIRFSVYAEKSARTFRDQTAPYARFVSAVRRADPTGRSTEVALRAADVVDIPVRYYDDAAGVAFCGPPVHVVVP
jgi:hypothetical protein